MSTYTAEQISEARRQLTVAVQQLASDTVRATGIDYFPSPYAPESWEALQTEYRLANAERLALPGAVAGKGKLPIYGEASDQTIYLTPAANHAFRYWHDMGHIQHNLSFTPADEMRLQRGYHLDDVWRALGRPVTAPGGVLVDNGSLPTDSVVATAALLGFKLYYADTIGQIEYIVSRGKFPVDQLSFALAYVADPLIALDTDY